jgi:hypothetical protein
MTVSSVAATPTTPSAPLREVPPLLLEQWRAFTRTPATVLHWRLQGDEWEWVEAFLDGRLDGVTKLFVAELPATTLEGYGFALGRPLMDAMLKTKFPRKGPWQPLAIPRGARDTDALAALLGSFANHAVGTWVEHVGLVVAPASIPDERAWLRWVQQLLESAVRFAPTARFIFLDDAQRPRYGGLGALGPRVCSMEAGLHIAARVAAMTQAADDGTVPGQLRTLTARTMQCVNEGRVDDANRMATAVEALANDARAYGSVVPVRFAVANAMTAANRHTDAVTSYRAAEVAAERAEAMATGTPAACGYGSWRASASAADCSPRRTGSRTRRGTTKRRRRSARSSVTRASSSSRIGAPPSRTSSRRPTAPPGTSW